MTASLLPLHDHEVSTVLFALNCFAEHCEAEGDSSTAEQCDDIAERVRHLDRLTSVWPEQFLRSVGLGRYRARPQG